MGGFCAPAQQIVFIFRTVVLQSDGLRRPGDHLLQRKFFVEHAGELQFGGRLRSPFNQVSRGLGAETPS